MTTKITLHSLDLLAGQAHTEQVQLPVGPYRQAGEEYRVRANRSDAAGGSVEARVDVSAMNHGWAFRMRFEAPFIGPCSRCLRPATLHIDVDAREVHDPETGDAELLSDFVTPLDELDLEAWAVDAVGLEFPHRVLCVEDCKGLCPSCGTNRNEGACSCSDETHDSRWDKLRELSFGDEGEPPADSAG